MFESGRNPHERKVASVDFCWFKGPDTAIEEIWSDKASRLVGHGLEAD
jgi:hypothetical protein